MTASQRLASICVLVPGQSILSGSKVDNLLELVVEILEKRQLKAVFQPIINMLNGEIIGFEGLIRGPLDSPLHSPLTLFEGAKACHLSVEMEHLAREIVLEGYAALNLPGKLFLNVSPEVLLQSPSQCDELLAFIQKIGIRPDRIILELTEGQPTHDYALLRDAATLYRARGFRIAIDDLGEGFSSLRLWSELRPEYVKIDMHFIRDLDRDPVKLQFVKSIQEIANVSGTAVIAEGIETAAELVMIKELGVAFGQGYRIARPLDNPIRIVPDDIANALAQVRINLDPQKIEIKKGVVTALKIMRVVTRVAPEMSNNEVYEMFIRDPELHVIPVVKDDVPLGLIARADLIDRFARPFLRELQGKKPCTLLMDTEPMMTDKDIGLQVLSQAIVEGDRRHLLNGFIITEQGKYLGIGSGHDLMREITIMQINAASHANPLTHLPGNVPINEHMEDLLRSDVPFCACYVDLDNFKPFNDVYGYSRGDDVIQLTGRTLVAHSNPEQNFVGHIGGDDFMILFRTDDWEARCRRILADFDSAIREHYSAVDCARGGYISEDRRGTKVFYGLISISLGVVQIKPGQYTSHHQIAAAAAEAKKQAKKVTGSSLFVDRRTATWSAIS
ncbi:GGDEF domain-containing protein [Glaciimonas sp. PAMC28666]|uniref:GGDEF domain-containing protein n=1 Tax=Glaciimonas sp. PAMC28666 TaxID=2807626 RepID=UPI001965DA18|nr:GGDEF domain-containing protein [Glaciimonas sp. PAMC28666]QRX81592.1 GGDEF domain-containing protein [Glaciimonas sp. PAMC28666]